MSSPVGQVASPVRFPCRISVGLRPHWPLTMENRKEDAMNERLILPVLPLRDVVLLPGVTTSIGAGRPGTVRGIETALATPDRLVFAICQRENTEQVTSDGLYTIGTIAKVGQLQRGLAGMQLLLHGERRGIVMHLSEKNGYLEAIVREAEEMQPLNAEDPAFVGLYREVRE